MKDTATTSATAEREPGKDGRKNISIISPAAQNVALVIQRFLLLLSSIIILARLTCRPGFCQVTSQRFSLYFFVLPFLSNVDWIIRTTEKRKRKRP
jgi:hypothetical protein